MFWGIKNNFLIKRWMKSEFMVVRMAGPKGVVIVRTYEGKDQTEERVKMLVLEWGSMNKLMYSIYGKSAYSTMQKNSKETNGVTQKLNDSNESRLVQIISDRKYKD